MLAQPHTSVLWMVSKFEQRFYSDSAIFNAINLQKMCIIGYANG